MPPYEVTTGEVLGNLLKSVLPLYPYGFPLLRFRFPPKSPYGHFLHFPLLSPTKHHVSVQRILSSCFSHALSFVAGEQKMNKNESFLVIILGPVASVCVFEELKEMGVQKRLHSMISIPPLVNRQNAW